MKKKSLVKRLLTILCIIFAAMIILRGCGFDESDSKSYDSTYVWPNSAIAGLLPQPRSEYGEIQVDSEKSFSIDIYQTEKEAYTDYVEACKENGFTVDYYSTNDDYNADNEDGYRLSVSFYEDKKVMSIYISAPQEESQTENAEAEENKNTEASSEASNAKEEVSSDFKKMMDSYEAFFDEYIAFMEKYENADDTASMLKDYADYMAKYGDYMQKMSELEDEELSAADAAYYVEVQARIMKKLADITY